MPTSPFTPAMLTDDNLITVLSDPQQRNQLQKAINAEHGSTLPLTNCYSERARTCKATSQELHTVVKSLLLFRGRYRELLSGLVFHPDLSEQTLLLLYEKKCCIMELAHRSGPQELLERIARKHRISEAITTLALRYYSKPEYSAAQFSAFLDEFAGDEMLRHNLTHTTKLPSDKQEVILRVFATPTKD